MADRRYKDQSASGLVLTLIEGPVDLEQFAILRARALARGPLEVRANIIGGSHVIQFVHHGWSLTEILACTGARADSSPVFSGPLEDLQKGGVDLLFPEGIRYRFRARLASTGLEALARIERRAERSHNGIGLTYQFPPGPSGLPPKTVVRVDWESAARIVATTAHVYPEEGRVAITTSRLIAEA